MTYTVEIMHLNGGMTADFYPTWASAKKAALAAKTAYNQVFVTAFRPRDGQTIYYSPDRSASPVGQPW